MFRPGFPRLSHPGLAQATPSTGFMAKVYRGRGKLTDQQRAAQAPTAGCTDDLSGFGTNSAEARFYWPNRTFLAPFVKESESVI